MDAENVVVDDGGERHVVEELGAGAPDGDRLELAVAFVVEAVDLGDLPAFVVASDEGDAVGVSCFEEEEEQKSFDGMVAAVDEISHEDVGSGGNFAAEAEELEKVEELAVDVAADGDGGVDVLDVGLFYKKFSAHVAKLKNLVLGDETTIANDFNLLI